MIHVVAAWMDKAQVYFSNRSAAYLKVGDAKSKALKDAERCMELASDWSKSYSRLGAAQHALRRFDAAVQTFKVKCSFSSHPEILRQFFWWANCRNAFTFFLCPTRITGTTTEIGTIGFSLANGKSAP